QPARQDLTNARGLGLPEELIVPAIQLTGFDTTPRTRPPTHLPIPNVIVRLAHPFEQQPGSLKPRPTELCARPMGSTPAGFRAVRVPEKQTLSESSGGREPFWLWKT